MGGDGDDVSMTCFACGEVISGWRDYADALKCHFV